MCSLCRENLLFTNTFAFALLRIYIHYHYDERVYQEFLFPENPETVASKLPERGKRPVKSLQHINAKGSINAAPINNPEVRSRQGRYSTSGKSKCHNPEF